MPSGGKRPGAGRKRGRDDFYRLDVGSRCEALWREVHGNVFDQKFAAENPLYLAKVARARAVPIGKRSPMNPALERALGRHKKSVKEAIDDDATLHGTVGKAWRVQPIKMPWLKLTPSEIKRAIKIPRQKGKRREILQQVAREESERRGRPIKVSMVDKCWKEYRAAMKKMRTETYVPDLHNAKKPD